MDAERRQDPEARERVDEIRDEIRAELNAAIAVAADAIREEVHGAIKILYGSVLALGIFLTAAFFIGNAQNSHRIGDVNASRKENLLQSCEDTNSRYYNTVAALDAVVSEAKRNVSPEKARELDKSVSDTKLLIANLAPLQNCDDLLRRRGLD